MFCPRCKIGVFGGSICHICATKLEGDTAANETPKEDFSLDAFLGKGKHKTKIKSDLTQSIPARVLRLVLEIGIFCALFVGVTYGFMVTSDFLSDQMESKLWRFNPILDGAIRNPVKYFWYVVCAIIAYLTIKYRWGRDA
jgi:hypothetical protein